jgi:predicted alpha/beta hydrolase
MSAGHGHPAVEDAGTGAVVQQTVAIATRDGRSLAGTHYAPAEGGRGDAVLINSATGVKRGYYDRYARFLAARGFDVLTYDYRGIGGSIQGRASTEPGGMRVWGEQDVAAAIDFAAARFPGRRLRVVGHSAGGQLFGLADNNHKVASLLGVSAQSGYWRHWRGSRRWQLFALWHMGMPLISRVLGRFPSRAIGFGEDLPGRVAREWARWCRHPDYIVDENGRPIRTGFEAFRGRIVAYAIADDWMAPEAAVRALMATYRNAEVEVRTLSPQDAGLRGIGHFGFFRQQSAALWPASCTGWESQ